MKRKMCKRLLALWVIFCLMFSSLPLYAVVTDDAMVDANTVLPIADDSMAQLKSSLSPVMPNLNEYVLSEGDLTTEELKKTTLSRTNII